MSTDMTWRTLSTGSAETEALGELLGRLLSPPAVVELRSDLGGGKTTFVKGLARGAGSDDEVTSPTFTLSQVYRSSSGVTIAHHDFYRLSEPGVMADELAESLGDDSNITVVEWGDIVKDVLPRERIAVEFKLVASDTDEREITFEYPENLGGIIKKLETEWTRIRP